MTIEEMREMFPPMPDAADTVSWGGPREDVFTAAQMRAYALAERERIAAAWDGVECDVHCNGLVDVGASIRAGQLVGRDDA